jgi:quinohemoprotein ethanol dehydrogenase
MPRAALVLAVLALACSGARPSPPAPPSALSIERVDDERLRSASSEPQSWLTYGGSYAEQRYSQLAQIDAGNVKDLGLAWTFETGLSRGHEATPIAVDGVIYTTGSWSVVFALDARTGKQLWRHDPQVPRTAGPNACCDVVNRGVAIYEGRVYAGTLDGRLQALDAKTGAVVWSVMTVDPTRPYTITMAPRVVKGRVIIGNGGAELGVRGYVSAYDADTGAQVWRFYTVPGDPSQPYETPELAKAAKTWDPSGQYWKQGGGGTVWNAIAFDPELDLLYVGTGNGSPWSKHVRSPKGGDNLFLSSVLALRPDTGQLVWYYQETPGDMWDYTATQDIVLADLAIAGKPRKVLLHAPKNGFFYVIDRATGVPISAKPFATVNWAKRIDPKTWRPVETPNLDYRKKAVEIRPSPLGAHNWQSMSFDPQTGLVYIPVNEIPFFFKLDPTFRYQPGTWNVGYDMAVADAFPREMVSGHLLAWDPVAQKEVWRAQYVSPWNGGTLATAGNLVFQGTAHGTFAAYRANDGVPLWEAQAGTGIVAAPISYQLDGIQYVAVMAGWGGAFALSGGDAAAAAGVQRETNFGRLLVYRLGGTAQLPVQRAEQAALAALPAGFDKATVKRGSDTYARWCAVCHGIGAVGAGVLPDLRRSDPAIYDALGAIVLQGARSPNGMPRFDAFLNPEDVAAIRAYLLARRAQSH